MGAQSDTNSSSVLAYSLLSRPLATQVLQQLSGTDTYPTWHISNKYYKAKVDFEIYTNLSDVLSRGKGSPACIVLASNLDVMTRDRLLEQLTWPELDVCLLIRVDDTGFNTPLQDSERQLWLQEALDANFELIDAHAEPSTVDSDDEEEDDEIGGMERAKEALESHLWPSMDIATNGDLATEESVQRLAEDDFEPFVEAPDLHSEAALHEFDTLGAMLSQLQAARGHAMTLPDDERRAYAADLAERFARQAFGSLDDEDD